MLRERSAPTTKLPYIPETNMAKPVEIASPAQLSSLLSSARVVVINCESASAGANKPR